MFWKYTKVYLFVGSVVCRRFFRKDTNFRLVLILAGALCYISYFFLVHSYALVGLYQISTVIYSWPARSQIKNHYGKVTKKQRLSQLCPKIRHPIQKNLFQSTQWPLLTPPLLPPITILCSPHPRVRSLIVVLLRSATGRCALLIRPPGCK